MCRARHRILFDPREHASFFFSASLPAMMRQSETGD